MTNPDPTESIRRELCAMINGNPQSREAIEAHFGQAWDTAELGRDYEVHGFAAPLVIVTRRADEKVGSLFFQHGPPRLYFYWQEDLPENRKAA
jgi:hypothetical protein